MSNLISDMITKEDLDAAERVAKIAGKSKFMSFTRNQGIVFIHGAINPLRWSLDLPLSTGHETLRQEIPVYKEGDEVELEGYNHLKAVVKFPPLNVDSHSGYTLTIGNQTIYDVSVYQIKGTVAELEAQRQKEVKEWNEKQKATKE